MKYYFRGKGKMNSKVRRFSKLLSFLLIVVLVILGACGDNSSNNNNNDTNAGEDKEITYWTLSLSPDFDDYINGMIDEFEEQNPGVTVNWQDIPFDQVAQRITTAASAGNLADVMNLNTEYLKQLASLGALVNMDEAASDVKDEYFEGVWKAGEEGNGTYAIPWYLSTGVLMYNTEILEEAGFDEPPTTEEEAWEMSEVIYEKTGNYGMPLVPHIQNHLLLNNVPLVSEDLQSAEVNTPEALEIFTNLKELYDKGVLPEEVLLGQTPEHEAYAQEKITFLPGGPQRAREVEDIAPEVYEKSDMSEGLKNTSGNLRVTVMNIAVSEASDHKDEAVEFAKFITNAQNQLEFAKLTPILPSIKEATEDEFFTEGKDSDDLVEKGRYISAKQLEDAVSIEPPVKDVSRIYDVVKEEFQRVLLEDKDPEAALEDAEEQINQILAEQ